MLVVGIVLLVLFVAGGVWLYVWTRRIERDVEAPPPHTMGDQTHDAVHGNVIGGIIGGGGGSIG